MSSSVANLADAPPRLRVCIVAKSTPFIWVHHYIKAFRALCDVVTVGPALSAGDLAASGRSHLAHLVTSNDIDRGVANADELVGALPSDWRPDLIVSIQSGAPPVENIDWLSCPTAHISVDTWHDFAEMVYARPFDFVFAAQREFAAHFAAAGCAHAHWLPLACDPAVHRPMRVPVDQDVVFVGSAERAVHARRAERIERLAAHFSVFTNTALDGEAMSRAYSRGRLAFNSSVAQDVNMRVFETMAAGVPLLTNRDADANGLFDLFRDGEHLIAYDLVALAERYLADGAARQRIAQCARTEVLARHTYLHRVRALLDTISRHVDWDAARARPLRRGHGSLLDYVPAVPGRAVDYGMNAGVSKYALRRLGVTHFTGVAFRAEEAARRAQSFDAVAVRGGPDSMGGPFDTAFAVSAEDAGPAQDLLAEARALLRPGGTLVVGLSQRAVDDLAAPGGPGDLWAAVQSLGFVVLRMELRGPAHDDDVGAYVVARRQERSLKDIAREIYSRNPIPGLSLEETVARVP